MRVRSRNILELIAKMASFLQGAGYGDVGGQPLANGVVRHGLIGERAQVPRVRGCPAKEFLC